MSGSAARIQQAMDHAAAGRLDRAKSMLLSIVQRDPADCAAHSRLVAVLLRLGEAPQAEFAATRAASSVRPDVGGPGAVAALVEIAWHLHDAGRRGAAERIARLAHELAPADPAVLEALLLMLQSAFRYPEMAALCREVIARRGPTAAVSAHLAGSLLAMGLADDAARVCREALASDPESLGPAVLLACTLNYVDQASPEEVLAAHRQVGQLLERSATPRPQRALPQGHRGRAPRIGLVSPDLRAHSVAAFIEPILPHLRGVLDVTCYYTGFAMDATSHRLAAAASRWRHVNTLSDPDLARQIQDDQIDILIDLCGLFARGRLRTFAMRPAPIQMTYLGYPNTTGMTTIDWRIVDSLTDPPGQGGNSADARATEQLLRLDPCFICYAPPTGEVLIPVAPPPSRASGRITFGSFNNLQKLSPRTVAAWARVLGEVDGCRLLLKSNALTEPTVRDAVLKRFVLAGVDADRLDLLGRIDDPAGHLAAYSRIDVALDTSPYCGTTTTCEALLMGVPVVSLVGRTHAGRVGLSLLTAVGLSDLAVQSLDTYVSTAAALARDPTRLAELRSTLRPRLLASALCDAPAFAARFTAAITRTWHNSPA